MMYINYMKRILFFILLTLLSATSLAGEKPTGVVLVAEVNGVINPVSAEYLDKAIAKANEEGARALVIMLDTPGGLDTSMRIMVKAIIGSQTPVVTYVSPSGARAASAGVFITMASPVAAMAPGTNIGAAHPVNMGGGEMDKAMSAKVENDSAAYIKSLAGKYGRNADWAEQAVRKSVSISAEEALKLGVVDLIAVNMDDLLIKLDGRKVDTGYGQVTLTTKGAKVERFDMGARLKLLSAISDPNIAYILMMIGILGIFFEMSNPGLIFPGVVGGMSLILAFYSLQTLPVNYAGLLLILLGIVFFIAEIKVTSYGLLGVAGVISLTLGSIMLIDSTGPYMRVSLKLILPVVATLSGFFVILIRVALRAHRAKVTTGAEGMIGETGEARSDIDPEGSVFLAGTHWTAYSDGPIKSGEKVTVLKVDGLKLKVTKKS